MIKAMIQFRNYRWAARLSGFLAFVLIASFMTGMGLEMLSESPDKYAMTLTFSLIGVSFLAYLAGWVVEIAGGIIMLVSGISLSFYLHINQLFDNPAHFYLLSVALIIPGLFYLFSWRHKLLRMKKAAAR
jgi:hypothetical protein